MKARAQTLSKPGIFRPCGFGEGPDEAPFVKELFATYLDDDVSLTHVRHATPIPRMLAESLPHDGNLLVCDESGQLLAQTWASGFS